MAWYDNCRVITAENGSTSTIYRFGVFAADGQWDDATAAQGNVDGIAGTGSTTVGEAIPVIIPDGCIAKVEAGAVTTAGGLASSDASGRAIDHVAAVDNVAVGRFLEAAGAAGEIIRMQFVHKRVDAG